MIHRLASFRCCCVVSLHLSLLLASLGQSTAKSVEKESITWVEGIVRDNTGKPIAGAKVYARATYHGGIRMNALMSTTVTDADGRYAIQGQDVRSSFSATLVAIVPGHPPAISWFSLPDSRQFLTSGIEFDRSPPVVPQLALVIPGQAGQLAVHVLKDGKVARGASVAIRLEGADPFDNWGLELGDGPERAELLAICRPSARVDGDGMAQFENLVPGLYSIFAIEDEPQKALGLTEYHRWFPFTDPPICGESHHIPVRGGEKSIHHVSMFNHGCVTRFQVLRNGEDWISLERLHPSAFTSTGDFMSGPTFVGKEWTNTFRFESAGFKQVSFAKYTGTSAARELPFYSADGAIAASPRLSNTYPVTLVAAENRGGGVRVRIEDAEGQPLAGTACFRGVNRYGHGSNSGFHDISQQGSLLSGFPPMSGWVEAHATGIPRIFPSDKMGSMPSRNELVNRSEILPQPITTENNQEPEITLRYEQVAYVKGRLKPPVEKRTLDYRISIRRADSQAGAGVFYKPDTGEFLAGPYRSGIATFDIFPQQKYSPILSKEFAVRRGEVSEVEIEVPADADLTPWHFAGKVVLDDGTTPNSHAALAKYIPSDGQVIRIASTDPSGAVQFRPFAYYNEHDYTTPPGTPLTPIAIAWLPGCRGANFVEWPKRAGQQVAIRLPPPISIRGRVLVSGDGDTIDTGTVTVRAQHEGRGKLDDLLSIETTAGADGAFELAGLTPGKYQVQAALDGIWLSQTVSLTVDEKNFTSLSPLELSIPAPGGPVLVRLTGERSRMPEKLFVQRPAGPLADRLWPRFLTPDGAGVVRIPALEAGKHFIRVNNSEKVVEVLSLTDSKGCPVEVELNLSPAN